MSDPALPFVVPPPADDRIGFRKYHNFLAALLARRAWAEHVGALPFDLTIDVSTACHLRCPYCATGNGSLTRPKAVLTPDIHRHLMRELGEVAFFCRYFSNGEPLLNKNLAEMSREAAGHGAFPIVSTNLSVPLDDEKIRRLVQSRIGIISVSLDGATAESYSRYRRGGDFSLVVDNINRIVELKRREGVVYPLVEWRFLRFLHNQDEEAHARALALEWQVDLLEFWNGYAPAEGEGGEGVFASTTRLEGPRLSGPGLSVLPPGSGGPLAAAVPVTAVRHADTSEADRKCDWLYLSTMIYPGGAVGPCCIAGDEASDLTRFGDGDSFAETYNCEPYRASRRMLKGGGPAGTFCDTCPNPRAGHYQFVCSLRSILRNAPDWAVSLMAANPDAFFFPIDRKLVPEVEYLFGMAGLAAEAVPPDVRGEASICYGLPVEGYLDLVTREHLEGWVWAPQAPSHRFEVSAALHGVPLASGQASLYRADLERAGKGDGRYHYKLHFERPLPEEAALGAVTVQVAGVTLPRSHR